MYFGKMYSRLLKFEKKTSYFLLGPRGTGKTYWLKKEFPEAIYLDLLSSLTYDELLTQPHRLENYVQANSSRLVIIDEVQKIPQLLNEVHRLIESRNVQFILTGSSARSLRKKGTNLLAGRARTRHMYPLTCLELEKDFSLEKSLQVGQLPEAYQSQNPEEYLSAYVQTYLREEVLQEGLSRNLAAFRRFLEAASFAQGSPLNVSNVARDCGMDRKVTSEYFNILEDLLLAFRLPAFSKRAQRRLVKHDKFYFFDVGVFRSLRPKGPLDAPAEIEGAGLETLFLQELRAINEYCNLGFDLFYWRTSNQQEVDFIAYGPKGLFAFEIKRKRSWQKKDLTSLKSFLKDYPMAKAFLVTGVQQAQQEGEIAILPYKYTLKNLLKILS